MRKQRDDKVSESLRASVREFSKSLLAHLAKSIRTARLYTPSHRNVRAAMQEFEASLRGFLGREKKCQLQRIEDSLYLNEARIKAEFGVQQGYEMVVELLSSWDIGQIDFSEETTSDEIRLLIELFATVRPEPEKAWEQLSTALKERTLPHIQAFQRVQKRGEKKSAAASDKRITMGAYFKAISLMDSVLESTTNGGMSVKVLTRAVQALVDTILAQNNVLLSLINVKDRGGQGSNHAVNVSILSVALGARMGLGRKLLGELGFAGLVHDSGRIGLDRAILETPLNEADTKARASHETHVARGVERLLAGRLSDVLLKSINVAFLHHYRFDQTGYPRLVTSKQQDVFTRIVAVADFYDEATTPGRLYRDALSPSDALRHLVDCGGSEFDPLVVKTLVHVLGLYPVGCMVRLNTGEVGTVVEPPEHPRFLDRPKVNLQLDAAGDTVEEELVSLMEKDDDGGFRRSILKLYQLEEIELELEEYLAVI